MIFRQLWRNGFQNISPLLCYIRHWRKWRPVTKSLVVGVVLYLQVLIALEIAEQETFT